MASQPNPTPLREVAPVTRTLPKRREQAIIKAARLIADDRVKVDKTAVVYLVSGDHDLYRVIADPGGIFCPCDARGPLCSHVLAVALIRQQGKPNPDRLATDLGVAS